MSKPKYNVVSLFSGAMGLDIGLERTGRFRIVACVEKETAFCKTIRSNKEAGKLDKKLVIFERDITNIAPEEILKATGLNVGEIDVLAGGPPCQSFSTAGKRGTTDDPRGTLLWQFLRFVEVLKPKFFLMENVRGLLSAALHHRPIAKRPVKGGLQLQPDEEPGTVIQLFAQDLEKIKDSPYHMDCFEVNAVNYGAPQLRERVFFIGNRYNVKVDFPDPTHGTKETTKPLQPLLFSDESVSLLPWKTLREAIADIQEDNPVIMDFSPRKKFYLSMVPEGSNWRSLPVEIQKESMGKAWHAKGGRSGWWRRLSYDLPCPTLVTMPNHASTALCHPTEVRALTLREYARIQEFPDDWVVCGKTHEQYAQIGNAVPVRLGQVAGEVIAENLEILKRRKWQKLSTKPEAYRIIYIQSHVRTRQWFKDGQTFVWHDGEQNRQAIYKSSKTKRKSKKIQQ
jgi:DNA (cytosine-5)-methyltransferase 1